MERLEGNEMKKKRPIKKTWYEWLINYIPESVRKTVGCLKDKDVSGCVSLFKTNVPENYSKPTVWHGKKLRKQFEEDNIIKNINNVFRLKKENETNKDRIIRDIKLLFE